MERLAIFAGNANPKLTADIAAALGTEPGNLEVDRFPDGETMVRIGDDVRGKDVYVVQSTCPPVNEHLMELLIIIDAMKRASANRITAVVPYYGYARQDRKHEGRVPITAKLAANMISAAGADRLLTMDLHSSQIQGFFDVLVDHLFARPVMLEHLKAKNLAAPVVMAPDTGSIKMADAFAKRLGAGLAVVYKRRKSSDTVEVGYVIGEIEKKDVIILDDMITTAGSMKLAIDAANEHGANSVSAMATHAVFCGPAFERLAAAAPDEVAVTDTIPIRGEPKGINLTVLSVAPLLADAIKRIHLNQSVSRLFE